MFNKLLIMHISSILAQLIQGMSQSFDTHPPKFQTLLPDVCLPRL